jgi:hypothetical protein
LLAHIYDSSPLRLAFCLSFLCAVFPLFVQFCRIRGLFLIYVRHILISVRLFLFLICSLYLVRNVRPVWPMYLSSQSLQFKLCKPS